MRRLLMAGLALAAACADPDPTYGDPNGISGRSLPKEDDTGSSSAGDAGASGGDFGGPYSLTNPKPPTTTLKDAHALKGGPAPDAVKDCFDCHVATSTSTAKTKPFAFGGRILGNKKDIDVMVVGIGQVKSDADGFFWMSGTSKAGNARARSATKESKMGGEVGAGKGCDSASCHGATNPGKVGSGI